MTTGSALQSGDVVGGKYRIEAPLGHGGFGVVYKATQLSMGRVVALKTLIDQSFGSRDGQDRRARFVHEAELAQRLEHPDTVRLYDFGETEAGVPYIALELLKGRALDVVLAAEGKLSAARAAHIGAQTLKSLMEAHALGIVHRDIKPSNIFLCDFSGETDFVKVLDFGIAKDTLVGGSGLTPAGAIVGTPAYMAPEQVRGSKVAPQTDLYALGMVLAELLTGVPVYASEVALDVINAHLSQDPVPLPREVLESPLGPVIARATQKAGSARFASAEQMLAALDEVIETRLARVASGQPPRVNVEGATVLAMEAFSPTVAAAPTVSGEGATVLAMEAVSDQDVAAGGAPPGPAAPIAATPLHVASSPEASGPPRGSVRPPPTRVDDALAPSAGGKPAAAVPVITARPARVRGRSALPMWIAGAVGAVAVVCLGLWGRHARGPGHAPRAVASSSTSTPSPGHFASLTNAQLTARIEAARIESFPQRVVQEKVIDATTTQFVLQGPKRSVYVVRASDVKTAEGIEQIYLKAGGPTATARDGTCVLHVEVHGPTYARLLLDQITR